MIGIVVFHKVLNEKDCDRFAVDIDEFMRIINILKQNGTIVKPEDIVHAGRNSPISFILSFDDGTKDHYEIVHPILMEQNIRGIFLVSTKTIGSEGYLSESQISELKKSGHDIGAHSHTHTQLTSLSIGGISEEVASSVLLLEDIIGGKIEWFAPPEGIYDERVVKAAYESGIRFFRTTDFGWNSLPADNKMLLLSTININNHFMSGQLKNCLLNKAVFYGYYLSYLIKNGMKRRTPLFYSWLRKLIEQ